MNRPQYQTTDDVANEVKLMRVAYPDRKAIKLPRSYHADFWIPKTDVLPPVVVECKQRSAHFGEYDTYMIALGKFMRCKELAEIMGGLFDIVVGWGDGAIAVAQIRYRKSDPFPYTIKPGGRTDRGDPADIEPMVHIGMRSFTELHTDKA